MFSLIVFILILSFLVIIHELGHFLTARFFKMRVEEFGVGYPPKAKSLYTDKHKTEYTINWLPFGGFVRLYGEDGEESVEKRDLKGAFFNKPAWQRLVVILAGATVNFVFGALAFGIIYSRLGIPTDYGFMRIDEVSEGSPAAEAGLMVGDEVVAVVIDGTSYSVEALEDFTGPAAENQGKTVGVVLQNREGEVQVYLRADEEIPEGEGRVGVVISDMEFKHYPFWQMPMRGMIVGVESAFEFGKLLLVSLGGMVSDLATKGQVPSEVAGPVGIVHTVQQEGILNEGFLAILNFAAILSINLAIINVLPFPALDGGRAALIMVEMVSRKKVNPDLERKLNTVGFLLLISLILLVTVRDVKNVASDYGVVSYASKAYGNLTDGGRQVFTFASLTLALFLTGLMVYFKKKDS